MWTDLQSVIAEAEAQGARLGVAVISPSGARFGHRADERFVAASTIKIAIMIALFRLVAEGRAKLDDTHILAPEDKAGGSGVIANLHPGLAFTLADLAFLMISISDNSATNILIDRVGIPAVNAEMRALGMPNSLLGRKMRGRLAEAGEQENWAIPAEFADMVAALLAGRVINAEASAAMVRLLETQANDRRIARHLPRAPRPRWGSKTGSNAGIVNDVGFVETPEGFAVISLFAAHVEPLQGEEILGALARAALQGK